MTLSLTSPKLRLTLDPDFGCEITSLVAVEHDVELLFQTPWGATARAQRRPGLVFPASASEEAWMTRYGGGWQVLFPHAGPPDASTGPGAHYHGEASVTSWRLVGQSPDRLELEVSLFTVPAAIRRTIKLTGSSFVVTDEIANLGEDAFHFDYIHHPAFGAPFLDEGCLIETGARTYVPDPRAFLGEFAPGEAIAWPTAQRTDGETVALNRLPARRSRILRFGWLQDFTSTQISVRNPWLGLGARLSWEQTDFDYAWFWLEAGASRTAPWFGRVYTLAIEPSTTPSAGPDRRQVQMAAGESRRFSVRFDLLSDGGPGVAPTKDDRLA